MAVGIEWRAMNAFENALDPSILAASALGPNTGIPTVQVRSWSINGAVEIGQTFSKVRLNAIDQRLLRPGNNKSDLVKV